MRVSQKAKRRDGYVEYSVPDISNEFKYFKHFIYHNNKYQKHTIILLLLFHFYQVFLLKIKK